MSRGAFSVLGEILSILCKPEPRITAYERRKMLALALELHDLLVRAQKLGTVVDPNVSAADLREVRN